MSVWEIAKFTVAEGKESDFESAVLASIPLFKRQEGCLDFQMLHSAEAPETFWLFIEWTSIAHHVDRFASSADFTTFVDSVTPFYSADPVVDHAERFVGGF
ncbi:putative quinol monooxygenase [Microbacterium tumbae]